MTGETDDKSLTSRPATALTANLAVAPRPRPAVPTGACSAASLKLWILAQGFLERNPVGHIG